MKQSPSGHGAAVPVNEWPKPKRKGLPERMWSGVVYTLFGKRPNKPFEPYVGELNLDGISARFNIPHRQAESCIVAFSGERDYLAEMISDLRPGDVFWDIGGYLGLVAVFVGKKLESLGGSVVVVEPDPELGAALEAHLVLNKVGNVKIHKLALGAEPASLRLQTSGSAGAAPSFYAKGFKDSVEVPVRPLDELITASPNEQPTHLKIDVEGFETQVLQGGSKALKDKRLRTIFLELHPKLIHENGGRWQEPVEILERHGFKVTYIHQKKQEMMLTLRRGGGA